MDPLKVNPQGMENDETSKKKTRHTGYMVVSYLPGGKAEKLSRWKNRDLVL